MRSNAIREGTTELSEDDWNKICFAGRWAHASARPPWAPDVDKHDVADLRKGLDRQFGMKQGRGRSGMGGFLMLGFAWILVRCVQSTAYKKVMTKVWIICL